jgi:hypothetical protein
VEGNGDSRSQPFCPDLLERGRSEAAMTSAEPWQTAEIPGPKKALVISKPEVAAAMIKSDPSVQS